MINAKRPNKVITNDIKLHFSIAKMKKKKEILNCATLKHNITPLKHLKKQQKYFILHGKDLEKDAKMGEIWREKKYYLSEEQLFASLNFRSLR